MTKYFQNNWVKITGSLSCAPVLIFTLLSCKILQSQLHSELTTNDKIAHIDPIKGKRCNFIEDINPYLSLSGKDKLSIYGDKNFDEIYLPHCQSIEFLSSLGSRDELALNYYIVTFRLVLDSQPYRKVDFDCFDDTCEIAKPRDINPSTSSQCLTNEEQSNYIGDVSFLIDPFNYPELARHLLTLLRTRSFEDGFVVPMPIANVRSSEISFTMRGFRNEAMSREADLRSIRLPDIDISNSKSQLFMTPTLYATMATDIPDNTDLRTTFINFNVFNQQSSGQILQQEAKQRGKVPFGTLLCQKFASSNNRQLCGEDLQDLTCSMLKSYERRDLSKIQACRNRSFKSPNLSNPQFAQLKVSCAQVSPPLAVRLRFQQDLKGGGKFPLNPMSHYRDEINAAISRYYEGH